jgi:hypothetical protein
MQREKIESIVRSLDTDTLLKLLAVAGIHVQPTGDMDALEALAMPKESPSSWKGAKVPLEGTKRPPIHDKKSIIKEKPPVPTPTPLGPSQPPAPQIGPAQTIPLISSVS